MTTHEIALGGGPTAPTNGVDVCRTIRASGCSVPILMVTARDAVEARIEGLDCGADDYMVKPFDFGELLARLRALVRRGQQPLVPVAGSGRGLWGRDSTRTLRRLRDEWSR